MKTQRPEHISEFLWPRRPPSSAVAPLPQITSSFTWPCLFPPPPCRCTLHSYSSHRYLYPFLHHFLHYSFFKIARLPLRSHRGKVLNLWSLHLKMFLTFLSPLLAFLDWFPTLRGFTAYVTNDEHVLFVCCDPSRRHSVIDVLVHIMTLLPTPGTQHMTYMPLCPVYSFRST